MPIRPILNSFATSQWLANLYLDRLDHFVKDDLGAPYYLRYMDDFVLVGPNKAWGREILERIEGFLAGMDLTLNPKTEVRPISQGTGYVGYRHWTSHVLPRKRTVKRARKQLKTLQRQYNAGKIDFDHVRARVVSFTGYMKHCNGCRTLESILERFILSGPGKPRPSIEPLSLLRIPQILRQRRGRWNAPTGKAWSRLTTAPRKG